MDRRNLISSGAAMGIGAVTGCALPGQAAPARSLFDVAQAAVPVAGSADVFPIRRIYCIGRNYAAHSREMGSDPTREPPFFFQKPSDAVQFVAAGHHRRAPLPDAHQELPLRARAGCRARRRAAATCRWRRRSSSSTATPSGST